MMDKNKRKSGLIRLLELSERRKGLLTVSIVTVIIHSILSMAPYVLTFYLLKELFRGQLDKADVCLYLVGALIAVIVSALMMFVSGIASHIAAFNILYELRVKITEKLGKLSMGYLRNRSSGALKKILADDVERIEKFIAHSFPDTIRALVLPLIILGYLFVIDYRLAFISLLPLIILVVAAPIMSASEARKMRVRKYHDSLEEMNSGIVEFVRAMPVVKIFGQSASAFSKYNDTVSSFGVHLKDWSKLTAPVWAMIMSFLTNAQLPLLIFGLYLLFQDKLDLSVFFLFLILGVGYIRPAFKLASVGPELTMISRGVQRIDEILFEVKEQTSGSVPIPDTFSVTFNKACFAYVGGIEVIKDVSFTVPQGSITTLVGPSGSGKSTLGQLIARFYDLQSGIITIGGVNIQDLAIEDLMNIVGFVFQDNMLFQQSIYDNILMGMDKTESEVIAAAKSARCHDFIMDLPKGYATRFGDRGVHLSGGEQQRIQLARVMLKDAPILVLDEATAFSDSQNEYLIMQTISELIQNKTVIIIAHRLSTIIDTDQIVVLNKGKIEVTGKHQELLEKSSLYSRMWAAHMRAKEFEILY